MHVPVTTYQSIPEIIEFLSACTRIYFDVETTGLDPHTTELLLVSIHAEDVTFVFDVLALGVEVLAELKPVFENPAIEKIAHNAVFDWKHIYHHGDIYTAPVYCTLIAEQVLKSGILFSGFGLDDVVERRLKQRMDKTIRENFIDRDIRIPFTTEELAYAAEDTIVLAPIYMQQQEEILAENLQDVILLESSLIPITAQLEYEGICIDEQRLIDAHPVVERLIVTATQHLQDEIIRAEVANEITFSRDGYSAVNVGSPKQMLQVFNELGIGVKSLGKKELSDWDAQWARKHKKLGAAAESEDDFDIGYAHPVLRQHAIRTAAAKLQGTYIEGLRNRINPVTKRIHAGWKQCGAASTGRMASTGPNMQNLPNRKKLTALGLQDYDIRSMFIPAPGCDFIICDYSGIELSILAAMCGDKELTEQILRGDIHTFVSNSLAGNAIRSVLGELITEKNKKSNPVAEAIRNMFKPVSYGIIYGSTGYNLYRTLYFDLLAVGIHITQDDTDRWVEMWKNELFPHTGALLEQNARYAVTRYYTESALGRRRHWDKSIRFDKWRMLAAMREGSNHPIQSTCADMLKQSMLDLDAVIDKSRGRIVAPVHDELLSETRMDYTDEAMPLVKSCMENAARRLYPNADPMLFQAQPKRSSRYDK